MTGIGDHIAKIKTSCKVNIGGVLGSGDDLFVQSTLGLSAYDIIENFIMKNKNFHYICFKPTVFLFR